MLNIEIKAIPHKEHRYPTVGDYWKSGGVWHFRTTKMPIWEWEFLVIVHELIEWALITHVGIKVKDIDNFDIAYEKARRPGDFSEPGDDWNAPYRMQHLLATGVEKILAAVLDVDWKRYENYIENL